MKNWKKISIACACLLFMTACSNKNQDTQNQEQTKVEETNQAQNTQTNQKEETAQDQKNSEKKTVYTSFYPMEYMTSRIAGDRLNVIGLMPTGMEVHDWEPAAKDVADLTKANLLVINGLELEGWLDDVQGELKDTKIVDTSESIDLIEADHDHEEGEDEHHEEEAKEEDHDEHEHDHHHGKYDPHVWISPKQARVQAKNIYDAIVEMDPDNKDAYTENYQALDKELEEIDKAYEKELAAKENKYIIVPHEAFGYLARDYGLEQVPMEGINSESEPDLNKMKELTDLAKEKNIKTVFYEAGGSDKAAQTLAGEIGGQAAPISTMESKTQDVIDGKDDYIKMLKDNLENIKKA
ncbi:MAG: zinc ABC transporter substrate-binding protein [Finegoldia sp.]|nr:zinc ABC transporter substrate-binding protein [Finegoldia sp.]